MAKKTDIFAAYVNHPRYGQRPRISNQTIQITKHEQFCLVSRCNAGKIFKNTAIKADMELQKGSAYAVKYFFDEDKTCVHCKRHFIFFAAEQKYWFDQLKFNIAAQGHSCFECRAFANEQKYFKQRYDALTHHGERTNEQSLEMAHMCLSLVESGVFKPRSIQTVQKFLNEIANDDKSPMKGKIAKIRHRIEAVQALSKTLEQNIKADILRAFPNRPLWIEFILTKVAQKLEEISRERFLQNYK